MQPFLGTKVSEVTLDSSDVCSCIPAQVALSYERGLTQNPHAGFCLIERSLSLDSVVNNKTNVPCSVGNVKPANDAQ